MVTATNLARVNKISLEGPQSRAALDVERHLLDHYDLQGRTEYVELKQTPIRVRILKVGTGRPVVVIPGGAGYSHPFLALAAQLKDRQWIIVNRPGAGLSDFVDHRQPANDMATKAMTTAHSVMRHTFRSRKILCFIVTSSKKHWLWDRTA